MTPSQRIVINTCVMYVRLAITMVVTLVSSRWVLLALGEEDFGIYNLIAGLLSLMTFLNLCMATSSQRFMSYSLGKGNIEDINETFYISRILHLLTGIIIVILIEVVGILMLNHVLQVPEGKMHLAYFCTHSLSISTLFTVTSVPYRATLISHENILFVAFVEILGAILKLIGAMYLLYFDGERLSLYAIFMTLISIITAILFHTYCNAHYNETHITPHRIKDYTLMKSILTYTGWNLIGSFSSLIRTQGIAMVLNSYHGVAMNTAYGIATQVKSQLSNFSSSIVTATRPQIVKNEGEGDRKRALSLSAFSCKASFLLLAMIATPLLLDMPFILEIWLKQVPSYTVDFTRVVVINSLIFQFILGIAIPMEAVGNIKGYQISVGILQCMTIPVAILMLQIGCSPLSVLYMVTIEEILSIIVLLFFSKRITMLNPYLFVIRTILPSIVVFITSLIICQLIITQMEQGWWRLLILCTVSIITTFIGSYAIAFTNKEREQLMNIIFTKINIHAKHHH